MHYRSGRGIRARRRSASLCMEACKSVPRSFADRCPVSRPIEEYNTRKEEQIRLINTIKTEGKLDIIDCDYDNDIYEEKIKSFIKSHKSTKTTTE